MPVGGVAASHVWNKLVNCGSSHNRGEATGEMAGE